MKKLLIIAGMFITCSSHAQIKQPPKKQMVAARNFMRPYKFYTDRPNSAMKLAIISAADNLLDSPYGAVQIRYVEISSTGAVLQGSQGMYNCKGNCYTAWNNSPSNNTAFQIVADSAVRHPIISQ